MHPLLLNEDNIKTTKGFIFYYNILAQYYKMTNNIEQSYAYRLKLVNRLESIKNKSRKLLYNQIGAINNLIPQAIKLGKLDEAGQMIKGFRNIPSAYPKKLISDDVLIKIFCRSYLIELMLVIATHDTVRGLQIIEEIELTLPKYESKIPPFPLLHLYGKIAVYCFETANYEDTLSWVNKALNHKQIKKTSDIYYLCIVLNLITRFDLDQYQLLEHLCRSTKRNLQKIDRYDNTERELLSFINSYYKLTDKKQKADLIYDYCNKWKKPTEAGEINLSNWIVQKMPTKTKSLKKT